jgi:DNA-binding NarL/FixJ family response regulator
MVTKAVVQHSDRLIRTGLRLVLDREPDIDVAGAAITPADLVALCAEVRPDAVVLELDTPEWDSLRLAAALRKRQRSLRVVGVYDSLSTVDARRAYQAGIRTTVAYTAGAEGVVAALRGKTTQPSIAALGAVHHPRTDSLTPRELEILGHIAAGLITREIAKELGVSLKTIENHKQRIFRKLGVQSQAHAVSIAIRRGLLAVASARHA